MKMNTQGRALIKSLLEEATEIHDNFKNGTSQPLIDYKIFAQLIISECLNLAQSHSSQNEDYAAGIDSVRDNIKQHFGIE